LVPFIKDGYKYGPQESRIGPTQRPSRLEWQGERFTPGAKEQKAEQPISHDVACLSQECVPDKKSLQVNLPKQSGENGIQQPAGLGGRKEVSGLNCDHAQP
jgi:hypothetical protein